MDLKPCPFCGSQPAHDHTRADGVRFSCLECEEAAFEDFEQAAVFWNRRNEALRLSNELEEARKERPSREAIAAAVINGYSGGNEQWDEADETRRMHALMAADAILSLPASPSLEEKL